MRYVVSAIELILGETVDDGALADALVPHEDDFVLGDVDSLGSEAD